MATLRCTLCGINYPVRGHRVCDVCGEKCDPVSNDKPHTDWKKRVEEAKESEKPYVIGPPHVKAEVTTRDGRTFISSWDVCRSGYYATLPAESIIFVNDVSYEIVGYSYSRREYWIEPV